MNVGPVSQGTPSKRNVLFTITARSKYFHRYDKSYMKYDLLISLQVVGFRPKILYGYKSSIIFDKMKSKAL